MTRSTPFTVLESSILPEMTTKSARASPSCTRNSPSARWMSAEVLAIRASSAGGRWAKSGTAARSSAVSMGHSALMDRDE